MTNRQADTERGKTNLKWNPYSTRWRGRGREGNQQEPSRLAASFGTSRHVYHPPLT